MEVLLYFGLPTKNEHDDFSRPQKFIAYPQPHEILKCHLFERYSKYRSFYLILMYDYCVNIEYIVMENRHD